MVRYPRLLRTVLVPAAVFLVLAGAFVAVWWSIYTRDQALLQRQTQVTAEQAAARLEDSLTMRLALVDQIRHEWLASPFANRASFTRRSLALQREFPGYLAVSWIDPDGIIRWVVPRKPNLAAENQDLHTHPFAAPTFTAAERTGQVQVTPPIELYQGGLGLAAYFPIITTDGTHLGYLNAVFRLEPLIRTTLRRAILDNYATRVVAGERVVFDSGELRKEYRIEARSPFRVHDQHWEVRLVPGAHLLSQQRPFLATLLLLLGLTLAASSAWLSRLAILRHEALAESEGRYRALFETVADLVFFMDRSGTLLDINEAGARLLGAQSKTELVGRNLVRRLLPDARQRRRIATRLAREGAVRDLEVELHRLDGETIVVRLFGSVVRDTSGAISGYRGVLRDVTEHRRLEERMARMQRMESLSILAGGIAHDFNNILATIQHRATILALRTRVPALQEHIEAIEASVKMAASLTSRLLTFARGDAHKAGSVDLNAVVRATLDIVASTMPSNITVETDLENDLPPVAGNEVQLQQVMLNLCINARDAMPDGGTLRIRTAFVMEPERRHPAEDLLPVGPWVRLEVQDTGHGMNPDTRQRAFDPFFTTKETGTGTGLGLAVVYGAVTGLGGHVDLDSEPGRGTVFTIHLPVISTPPSPPPPVRDVPDPGSGTVLVVDDDEAVRSSLAMVLDELGYSVLMADSGERAIELYGSHGDRIDVVILDMTMPGLDGAQTFERLRSLDPELPVIVSTGFARSNGAAALVEAGAVGVLHKPFRIRDLVAALQDALD